MDNLRLATHLDIDRLKEIWFDCFNDEIQYINFFYDKFFDASKTYLYCHDNYIVSMAKVLDVKLSDNNGPFYNGGYVYAVATDPLFKGRGYIKKLMSFLENESIIGGLKFLTLVPANKSLFDMYSKIGYQKFSSLDFICKDINYEIIDCDIISLDIDNYFKRRDKFLDSLNFSLNFYGAIKEFCKNDVLFSDYKAFILSNNSYEIVFLCGINNDVVYVKEVLKKVLSVHDIGLLLYFCKGKNLVLQTKKIDEKLKFVNKTYSMIKFFDGFGINENVYMNLMLD